MTTFLDIPLSKEEVFLTGVIIDMAEGQKLTEEESKLNTLLEKVA